MIYLGVRLVISRCVEITLRRDSINNKQVNQEAITKDGWLKTGDLDFMQNAELVITRCAKEVVLRMAGIFIHMILSLFCNRMVALSWGSVHWRWQKCSSVLMIDIQR